MRDDAFNTRSAPGRLWYVMGPSGAGKDSLLREARTCLSDRPEVRFARRYITRPSELDGEDHIALSTQAFEARLAAGAFFLHWRSHGYAYGIDAEVRDWVLDGLDVCVNGSRAYLPTAQRLAPTLVPVLVQVSPQRLRERLHRRGRETTAEIEARMRRSEGLAAPPRALLLDNNGPLGETAATLCRHILAAGKMDRDADG